MVMQVLVQACTALAWDQEEPEDVGVIRAVLGVVGWDWVPDHTRRGTPLPEPPVPVAPMMKGSGGLAVLALGEGRKKKKLIMIGTEAVIKMPHIAVGIRRGLTDGGIDPVFRAAEGLERDT